MAQLKELTRETWGEVSTASRPCLVVFSADWCPHCRRLRPVLEDLAGRYQGKALFFAVDVDKERQLARSYRVSGIPAVLFFAHGDVQARAVGEADRTRYSEELDRLLRSSRLA